MLSSAAASVVVSLASPDMALYINAVCFLISIAVTLLMVPPDAALWREGVRGTTAPVSDGMSLRDFFAGAAFIVRTPLVRAIVIMVVLTNLLDSAAMNVLWALYARTVSSDGAWYGVMTALFAAGADRSGHRRHAIRQRAGWLSGPVHDTADGVRHHRRLLCRRFRTDRIRPALAEVQ